MADDIVMEVLRDFEEGDRASEMGCQGEERSDEGRIIGKSSTMAEWP